MSSPFPLLLFFYSLILFVQLFTSAFPFLNYGFQIIVLENGKVIEQGPHEVLLSKAGRYAQLWGQQNNSPDGVDPAVKLEAWISFPSHSPLPSLKCLCFPYSIGLLMLMNWHWKNYLSNFWHFYYASSDIYNSPSAISSLPLFFYWTGKKVQQILGAFGSCNKFWHLKLWIFKRLATEFSNGRFLLAHNDESIKSSDWIFLLFFSITSLWRFLAARTVQLVW